MVVELIIRLNQVNSKTLNHLKSGYVILSRTERTVEIHKNEFNLPSSFSCGSKMSVNECKS